MNSQPSSVNSQQSRVGRWRFGTLPIAIFVLSALAIFALVKIFAPPPKPDATWLRMIETGEFRVGIDPSFPPFEWEDGNGNLQGLDIALAAEMARVWSSKNNAAIRVEYVYSGFDGLFDALTASQFDAIISALPYDPKKTQDAQFSHAYFDGGPLIVVRASDEKTQTHFDLEGKRIGVELGSNGDGFARKWQRRLKYDLQTFNTPADALRALWLGQVDAAFTDYIAFVDFSRPSTSSGQASGIKTVGAPLANEMIVIAVRKDAPTLLGKINAVIVAMKQDGRMEKLYEEWLVSKPD
ncbi:MAG: amino acid ABC transporter substrate-binding protein [Chloroflexi bacterium]|nr:amino acid ABC transporter substrate-binding protein [Chloroflexota bacterium]